jgi:hypothetical protein
MTDTKRVDTVGGAPSENRDSAIFHAHQVQAARRHLDAFINLRGNNFEYELQKIE